MKNLTAAIFLTLLFFTVSAFSEEYAVGFSQNPEYSIPVPVSVTPEEAKPVQSAEERQEKPEKRTAPPDLKTDGQAQNVNHNNTPAVRQSQRNSFSRETVWTGSDDGSRFRGRDRDLKDWENRNSPVPQSLPRATFPLRRQSSSTSRRCRSFRSSSPKISRIRISTGCNRTSSSCSQKTITVKTCPSCR